MDNYYRALTLPELLLPICLSELGKVLTMSDLAPRFLRQHLLRCFLTTPLARASCSSRTEFRYGHNGLMLFRSFSEYGGG